MDFQLSREKSRKTEEVFLVGSRESEGKSKSPPNRECSSRFGKEEMSTEDKRRRLRRLVPSWSFLTRQRFLLEKQKKMLCRTCKFAAVHRALCSFPETPEASPMRGRLRGRLICTPFYIDFHICNSCFYIDMVILIFAVQNPSYFT